MRVMFERVAGIDVQLEKLSPGRAITITPAQAA